MNIGILFVTLIQGQQGLLKFLRLYIVSNVYHN
jgi:hypothetical protein